MNYIVLNDLQVSKYVDEITKKIQDSNYKPDIIISLGRGGMIPTRLLSDSLSVKEIAFLPASMYIGVKTRNIKPKMGTLTASVFRKNILLVDDILDTGITIDAAIEILKRSGASDIKTATLLCKKNANRKPTYFYMNCTENDWIIFPWEKKEFEKELKNA